MQKSGRSGALTPGPIADSTATDLQAWLGEVAVLDQLLDWGADVDEATAGDAGQSPLLLAAWRGQVAATRLLCTRGAAVGAIDRHGASAAGAAAQAGHL